MALVCSSEFAYFPLFIFLKYAVLYLHFAVVCSEVPEEPVLSPVSNNVFERRLVVKYIHENGTDPINGEPLAEDQLLEIKGSAHVEIFLCEQLERTIVLISAHPPKFYAANPLVKPRPPSATSIPAILKLLQDEWVCFKK